MDYLPAPNEVSNHALDQSQDEKQVELSSAAHEPLVALAFKLEEGETVGCPVNM